MNFSKLLCLVLVCSEPFGQVLADTTPVCNGNVDGNTIVQCRGKKGGALKLKVTGTVPSGEPDVTWQKGTMALTIDGTKLKKSGTNDVELTINTLAEDDEGEYKAQGVTPVEDFKVQVVDCLGGKSSEPAGLCQGKPGGSIKLGLSDDGTGSTFSWKKGTDTASGNKYGPVDEATLMIKNLDDDDEKEFTGGPTGSEDEKFSVQVADCFGAAGSNVPCQGELTKALKLRISDAVSGSKVEWEKEVGKLPASSKKVGPDDVGLKLTALTPADAGTYKATYGGNTVSFAVRIPDTKGTSESDTKKKESTENGKDNSGGGGGSGTDQVNLGKGAGDPGGVGGLSYSPALLVTVTLVHLLLQLAA